MWQDYEKEMKLNPLLRSFRVRNMYGSRTGDEVKILLLNSAASSMRIISMRVDDLQGHTLPKLGCPIGDSSDYLSGGGGVGGNPQYSQDDPPRQMSLFSRGSINSMLTLYSYCTNQVIHNNLIIFHLKDTMAGWVPIPQQMVRWSFHQQQHGNDAYLSKFKLNGNFEGSIWKKSKISYCIGVIKLPILDRSNNANVSWIFGDFPYNSALFGLVSWHQF